MKRYILTLSLVVATFLAIAASGPKYSSYAKATNLKEVCKEIAYPISSKLNGMEGTVLMYVTVNEEGKVIEKTALSYPCLQLKAAAEKAIDNLKFEPAKDLNGNAVTSNVRVPFYFELTAE